MVKDPKHPHPLTVWKDKFFLNYLLDSPWILHGMVNDTTKEIFVFYYQRDTAAIEYAAQHGCQWEDLQQNCRPVEDRGRIMVGVQVLPVGRKFGEAEPVMYQVKNPQQVFTYTGK